MFRASSFGKVKNCGRLLLRPYSLSACGRSSTITPTLLKSSLPQIFTDLKSSSLPVGGEASLLSRALSTSLPKLISEKTTPEIEQLLEVAMEEAIEDEESKSGVRLAKTHTACSEMVLTSVREIVLKYVDVQDWQSVPLANPSLKFKIVSEAMAACETSISNVDLTNILLVSDLVQVLSGTKGKAVDAFEDPWSGRDRVQEWIEARLQDGTMPPNVAFTPRSQPIVSQ